MIWNHYEMWSDRLRRSYFPFISVFLFCGVGDDKYVFMTRLQGLMILPYLFHQLDTLFIDWAIINFKVSASESCSKLQWEMDILNYDWLESFCYGPERNECWPYHSWIRCAAILHSVWRCCSLLHRLLLKWFHSLVSWGAYPEWRNCKIGDQGSCYRTSDTILNCAVRIDRVEKMGYALKTGIISG